MFYALPSKTQEVGMVYHTASIFMGPTTLSSCSLWQGYWGNGMGMIWYVSVGQVGDVGGRRELLFLIFLPANIL